MPGLVPGIHAFPTAVRRGWHTNSAVAEFGTKKLRAGSNRLADKPGHDGDIQPRSPPSAITIEPVTKLDRFDAR